MIVERGRRAGVRTASGVNIGILVHTTAAVLGLSVLLRTSAIAYSAVKLVDALYLVYLGVQTLRSDDGLQIETERGDGDGKMGKTGFDGVSR